MVGSYRIPVGIQSDFIEIPMKSMTFYGIPGNGPTIGSLVLESDRI